MSVFYNYFASERNLDLAFTRLLTSTNRAYKNYFRHLYTAYDIARRQNIADLTSRLRGQIFEPSPPAMIYRPKKTGVLRPVALLSVEDQIVYQGIANVFAERFAKSAVLSKRGVLKSFGAILSGPYSPYFFMSWKRGYQSFAASLEDAFDDGYDHFSEFDLVSFYELIDHSLLKLALNAYSRADEEVTALLFRSLRTWTNDPNNVLAHGVPQGPLASTFFADVLLYAFDNKRFRDVRYFRYIDDIRLLARSGPPVRRALIALDIGCKQFGLVPQAQKITVPRQAASASEMVRSIPSLVLQQASKGTLDQIELRKLFYDSLDKAGDTIVNPTKFKYAIHRLNPTRFLMRRLVALAERHPELCDEISTYFAKCGKIREVVPAIQTLLSRDPVYDFVAACYLEALDKCNASSKVKKIEKLVLNLKAQSIEKSMVLQVAADVYVGKRVAPTVASHLVQQQSLPLAKSLIVNELCGNTNSVFNPTVFHRELVQWLDSTDRDLARYAAAVLITSTTHHWRPRARVNPAAQLTAVALGVAAAGPSRPNVLDTFFNKHNVGIAIPWRKALRSDKREVERRAKRLRTLETGDPTAHLLMLDTFNELLVQGYSKSLPSLQAHYRAASGSSAHPDYGSWLTNGHFVRAIPPSSRSWFAKVHDGRVVADLAHAKSKKGMVTKPMKRSKMEGLMKGAAMAWRAMFLEWKKVL